MFITALKDTSYEVPLFNRDLNFEVATTSVIALLCMLDQMKTMGLDFYLCGAVILYSLLHPAADGLVQRMVLLSAFLQVFPQSFHRELKLVIAAQAIYQFSMFPWYFPIVVYWVLFEPEVGVNSSPPQSIPTPPAAVAPTPPTDLLDFNISIEPTTPLLVNW